jgi:SagB-type dehydrogenase family enzyme
VAGLESISLVRRGGCGVDTVGGWRLIDKRLSRRRLLTKGAGVGAGLTALALVGCDQQEQEPTPTATATAARGTPTQEVLTPVVNDMRSIALPAPRLKGEMSLEEAVSRRRSRREFKGSPLTLEQVSQVLWAAQGITDPGGLRAAPSAGALYPLDVYLVVGEAVEELAGGVYHYEPQDHTLERILERDVRRDLARLAAEQTFIAEAPLVLVITGEYERSSKKYSERAARYVHMEAGHVAQNVYLQAETLGLGTVVAGAFSDEELARASGLPTEHRPLYIMPVGYAAAT